MPGPALKVSVIVPVKDMAASLDACLDALVHQHGLALGRDYEIIVSDDGSSDGSGVGASRPGVRVLHRRNAGPAAARNAGAAIARGEILAFTDADCRPGPRWLASIVEAFADAEVMGAKGVYRTAQHEPIARFVQKEYEYKYRRLAGLSRIDFVDTYSAAYRREVFQANGGFDERFPFPSVEDQEFSFRLAIKGYRLVFCPRMAVMHCHDRTLAEYVRRKFSIAYWKVELLRRLPEKTFADSHTPRSQRWQILCLGLGAVALVLGIFWPPALAAALAAGLAFLLSAAPFLAWIGHEERELLFFSVGMLLARAAALGVGMAAGFCAPPSRRASVWPGLRPVERLIKRGADVAGALVGLALSLPLLLVAMLAVWLEDGRPIFFVQQRAGQNGRPFRMLKLRSMVAGAEADLAALRAGDRPGGPACKQVDDPRVTRVGRVLRRWSLDELPQLLNVLAGEMSLVGPRPEELWRVERYDDRQRQRLIVKPGLTGPMQVGGRGLLSFEERLALELEYVNHYSWRKDLRILWQTIPAVLSGKGAF